MVVFYERQFIMKEYFRILKQKVKDFWRNLRVREQWAYITALSRKIYAKAYNKINVAGTYLGQIGISANAVSWSGFVIGVFAVNFIAMEMYGWALLAILLNRFCDGLDGAIARSTKVTDFGVFLDATLDYIFYGGVILPLPLPTRPKTAWPRPACCSVLPLPAARCWPIRWLPTKTMPTGSLTLTIRLFISAVWLRGRKR